MAASLEQSIAMKKEIVMDSNTPYLPPDIITSILKYLPVKSLIRFQHVCKDWKNLFKTSSFIKEHLHHSSHQNPYLLLERSRSKCIAGHSYLMNPNMQVIEYQVPPFRDSSMGSCKIIGSSNGLLCLKLLKSRSYFLWNPAIREVLNVPKGSLEYTYRWIYFVGFGFSPIVNDYMLVRLFVSIDDDPVYLVEVFSLNTRSWKDVKVLKLKSTLKPIIVNYGFTFNGEIFWFGFIDVEVSDIGILSFDMTTEALTFITIPSSAHVSDFGCTLTTYENKLAILSNRLTEDDMPCSNDLFLINLWVMEESIDAWGERRIWTKMHTISPYKVRTIWRNKIVWESSAFHLFSKEAKGDVKNLVLGNLYTNEFKFLHIGKYDYILDVWNYAESLVSVF